MDPSVLFALMSETNIERLASGYPELIDEFRRLNAIRTAATFSGLLLYPDLQANCLRLEALVHFASLYCEGADGPSRGFVRRAFDGLSEGYCGMQEDPAEDVFAALVNTPKGTFRIFEGIREGNAFHLQRVLNVVETMPPGGPYERLRDSVESLLRISEALAERVGIHENSLGRELPIENLPADLVRDLSKLRTLVKFSEGDLRQLHVAPETLAEFVFDPGRRDRLTEQSFGHTDLERRPIVFLGESMYVLLPTAMGTPDSPLKVAALA